MAESDDTAAQEQRRKDSLARRERGKRVKAALERGRRAGFAQGVEHGRATFPAPPPEMGAVPGPAPASVATTEHQGIFSRSRTVGDAETWSQRRAREKNEKLQAKSNALKLREYKAEVAQKTGLRGWLNRRYAGAQHRREKAEAKEKIAQARILTKTNRIAAKAEKAKLATTRELEKNNRLQAKIARVELKAQLKEAKRKAQEAEERIRNREKERNTAEKKRSAAEKARKKAARGPGLFARVFHRESRSIGTGVRHHKNGRVSFVARHSQHYHVREK